MCATCGCGQKDKKHIGYGKGPKAKGKGPKSTAPAAKKMSMNRKKGM